MKNSVRRAFSLLVALALLVSLLPGVTIIADAATVDYVTGTAGSYSNVIKNWGSRGTTATFLSPNAELFYTDTTYEELAALSGSTSTSSVPSSELYLALQDLMKSNHTSITSYDGTKELYAYTDCEEAGNYISAFYSGMQVGPEWDSGATWNREHTWPNSKGLGGSDENDIMMLRPASASVNSGRGNKAYGVSSGFYDPNEPSGGTYNLHGDVARIVLYVYVRWANTSYMWGSDGVIESLDLLLDWMEEDPVDTWEMGRNDSVESITGTRNVFVDYPELAFLLFGQAVPEMTTPSGNAAGSEYTITATVNDASMGSAVVSGQTITAYPAEGYQVAGYTLVSGTATVTQSGNIFTVQAESDCTVCINFSARTPAQVTYYENGIAVDSAAMYVGDKLTLPTHSGTVPEGYNFLGWITENLDETETRPGTVYEVGDSYTITEAVTFYSLYSRVQSGGTGTGLWTLVTDASRLTAGAQVIIAANSYGYVAGSLSSTFLVHLAASFADDLNTVVEIPDGATIFTLGGSDGAWTFTNGDGELLYSKAAKNLNFSSGVSTWTISIASSGAATITSTTSSYGWIQYNANAPRFTTYVSNQKLPQIYMMDGDAGTVYYSTYSCAHANTSEVAAVEPSCLQTGYTAGVICDDCGVYVSGHEFLDYADHVWDEGTVMIEATFEDVGVKEYTCTVCEDSKTEEYEKPQIDLAGTSVTLEDSLDLSFFIDITQLEEDGAYAEITRTYADGRQPVTVTVEQADWKQYGDSLYYFTYDGIAAKEMGDSLTVEVYNTFGTCISNPYTDSVKAYALRMLEKETDTALLTVLVDMLNYGAAAQTQFGYDAENLVNADLTDTQKGYATVSYEMENGLVSGPGRAGTALTLKNRITLDFIFKNSVIGTDYTGLYAVAAYTDHDGRAVETRIDTVKTFSDGYGYVSVPGLAVADYGQAVTCTVYDAEGNVLAWAADSMEGYAYRMRGSLPEMVDAIMKFGVSAYNYFESRQ